MLDSKVTGGCRFFVRKEDVVGQSDAPEEEARATSTSSLSA
jgi:hypothetical protein